MQKIVEEKLNRKQELEKELLELEQDLKREQDGAEFQNMEISSDMFEKVLKQIIKMAGHELACDNRAKRLEDYPIVLQAWLKHATDGKAAVYSSLNELKEQGHYQKIPVRDSEGKRILHWEDTIGEVPMVSFVNTPSSLLTDFQEIENQDIDNQDIENRERNNNYINNNYKTVSNNQSSQVMFGYVGQTGQTIQHESLKLIRL